MISVNDLLLEQSISHQIDLAHYSNATVAKMVAALNRSDARLFADLVMALQDLDAGSFTVERLESLLGSVRALNAVAYAEVGKELRQELLDFVQYEASYQAQAMASVLPVQVHVASVSAESVYAAAMARPFQGVLLNGVLGDIEASRAKKIRTAIAQGFTEGKTQDQIIRELRGTRAKGYADGLMEAPRREVATITRTAMGHMAGFVQDRFGDANGDIIKAINWSATIDLHTSPICRARDGKLYEPGSHKPIGHKLPWLGGPGRAHWCCRSAQTFVTKSFAELGIEGIPEFGIGSTRASMDGQVPKDTTYADWIMRQSAGRQDQVLGTTRAKLLRDGDLKMADLYDNKGIYLSLAQLRERDAAAFKRAGL